MIEHVIDLSTEPARLSIDTGRLLIDREGADPVTVPIEEVAVLVVAHPQVTYTQAVLAQLAQAGGVFIACDNRRLPAALMLPLAQHHRQTARFADQANASAPAKKRAWQQIVTAKIRAQARLLEEAHGDDRGLAALVQRVKSGDPDNLEGQAARRYWPVLFDDPTFRRDRDLGGPNALLNYGYAVLRAIIARAICAAGLHPSLGVHHHNQYDAFCLADDLMESFRPLVDRAVVGYVRAIAPEEPELDKDAKAALIGALAFTRYRAKDEARTLFDIAARLAASLVKIYAGQAKDLWLPPLAPIDPQADS